MTPPHKSPSMHYVYRMRSLEHPEIDYIGVSSNVKARLKLHNHGNVSATASHRPWGLSFYAGFHHKQRAKDFARFLRSEPGREFAKQHLW